MKQLIIRKKVADQIKEGMIVKAVKNIQGLVITKTDKMITVLTDIGCYDYHIVSNRK